MASRGKFLSLWHHDKQQLSVVGKCPSCPPLTFCVVFACWLYSSLPASFASWLLLVFGWGWCVVP